MSQSQIVPNQRQIFKARVSRLRICGARRKCSTLKVMDTPSQNGNVALPVMKRVFGLGLSGGLVTSMAGAVLHGSVNAILAVRAPDWQNFSAIVGAGIVSGGIISLVFGTIAFGVAGALAPHPKGSSVFRSLCRQTLLGMVIGSLLGFIGGASLGAMLRAAQSSNNNSPVGRDVMRYFDSPIFFLYAFYGALLLMLIGLVWGVVRGARQAQNL